MSETRGVNPKDAVGTSKAPISTISRRVMHELGLAMLEGECQYWRSNYRVSKILAMVYVDAAERHISAWVEGQDIDPDSGLSHLVKAMACLMIVRDAQLYGSLADDRPPAQSDPNWMASVNQTAKEMIERKAHFVRGVFTEGNREQWPEMAARLANGPIRRDAAEPQPVLSPAIEVGRSYRLVKGHEGEERVVGDKTFVITRIGGEDTHETCYYKIRLGDPEYRTEFYLGKQAVLEPV